MAHDDATQEIGRAPTTDADRDTHDDANTTGETAARRPREIGGPKGPEPTRYGDWERKGRCVDF